MGASRSWQVQEAKQRLSELLREVERGEPQVISRHGRDVAVVVDIAWYRRAVGAEVELGDYLRHGPHFDDLDLERARDLTPVVELDVESATS